MTILFFYNDIRFNRKQKGAYHRTTIHDMAIIEVVFYHAKKLTRHLDKSAKEKVTSQSLAMARK